MVIKSINKFFGKNGRWIFGIFTIIIIVSFMGIMTPGQIGGCTSGSNNAVGTVMGEDVDITTIQNVMRNIQLVQIMTFGRALDVSVENAMEIHACIKLAEQRGLAVSDDEVAEYIRSSFRFQKDGKFDVASYDKFCADVEKQGFSKDDIYNAVSTQLLVTKLQQGIIKSIVVTDAEIAAHWQILNTKNTYKYLQLNFMDYINKVKCTDAELQEYFKKNKAKYNIPAKAKAVVAVFESTDPVFVKEAAQGVDEKAMKEFYENNKTLFSQTVGEKTEITPFDKAKNDVKTKLIEAKAVALAYGKAEKFVSDVITKAEKNSENSREIFTQLAGEGKIKLVEVPEFSETDMTVGNINAFGLAAAAVKNAEYPVPVTDAIRGANGFYVAFAFDYKKTRPAAFEEVKMQVTGDCTKDKAIEAAKADCDKIYTELSKFKAAELAEKIKADKRFIDIPATSIKDLNPTDMFSPRPANVLLNIQGENLKDVITLKAGELSKTVQMNINTERGPMAIGSAVFFLTKAEIPDMKKITAAEKEQAVENCRMAKINSAMIDFRNYIRSQCKVNTQK